MAKVVINRRHGGFGLSDAAYEWLIARGVPVRKYIEQPRLPDGRYAQVSENEGEIIFDRDLSKQTEIDNALRRLSRNRYWEGWISQKRSWPLLVECVEALGEAANGAHAKLAVVEIPDGVQWEIDEYDGLEWVAETHRTWR